MNSKALWFISFVVLSLVLFASISIAQYYEFSVTLVIVIIGVIITTGAVLHFHYSGNIKHYPIQSFTQVWKDSSYGDTTLFSEGIKSDMEFMPWDQITRISVTTVDFRSGTTVVIFDKDEHMHVMTILDMDGFKTAVAAHSKFNIQTETTATGL